MSLITLAATIAGLLTLLVLLIALLPTGAQYPLPDWVATSVQTAVGYVRDLYSVFPNFTTAVLIAAGFFTVVYGIVYTWKFVRFVIRTVRGARV